MLKNAMERGFFCRETGRWLLRAWSKVSALVGPIACIVSPANAGPPYLVDDPGTLDHRRLFLYVAEIGSLLEGTYTHTAPNLVLGYGIRPDLEVTFGLSGYASNTPAIALDRMNNPALALKWRFREEGRRTPALALAYQVTLITLDQGFGRGHSIHTLYLTGSKSLGKGLLWANAGGNVVSKSGAGWLYGVACDYPLGRRWRIGAQWYGNSALTGNGVPEEHAWGVGATCVLNDYWTLLLQVGRSMKGNGGLITFAGVLIRLTP